MAANPRVGAYFGISTYSFMGLFFVRCDWDYPRASSSKSNDAIPCIVCILCGFSFSLLSALRCHRFLCGESPLLLRELRAGFAAFAFPVVPYTTAASQPPPSTITPAPCSRKPRRSVRGMGRSR